MSWIKLQGAVYWALFVAAFLLVAVWESFKVKRRFPGLPSASSSAIGTAATAARTRKAIHDARIPGDAFDKAAGIWLAAGAANRFGLGWLLGGAGARPYMVLPRPPFPMRWTILRERWELQTPELPNTRPACDGFRSSSHRLSIAAFRYRDHDMAPRTQWLG